MGFNSGFKGLMFPLLAFYLFLDRAVFFHLQIVCFAHNDTTAWPKFGRLLRI